MTEEQESLVALTMAQWGAHPDLPPISDACLDEYDRLNVWVLAPDQLGLVCGGRGCGPGAVSPCLLGCFRHIPGDSLRVPGSGIFVLESNELPALLHEALHWLSSCTWGSADPGHTRQAVWVDVYRATWEGR